ncbi:MAG: AIR carboxylase family protein [Candidatus Diapherotrites archaeon]
MPSCDVLAIFGSGSDRAIFGPLMRGLAGKKVNAELRICSAHKTPEELRELIAKTCARVIVAGAGLSAALPGACAAHAPTKPVIGVPVQGAYAGLDALLTVHQMPPGIPVLGTGVGAWTTAAEEVPKMFRPYSGIVIVNRRKGNAAYDAAISKAERVFAELGIKCETLNAPQFKNADKIYIDFLALNELELVQKGDCLVLHVPVAKQGAEKAEDALKLLKGTRKGLFLRLNAGDNAALAAVQVMNIAGGAYESKLQEYRRAVAKKVNDADGKEKRIFA